MGEHRDRIGSVATLLVLTVHCVSIREQTLVQDARNQDSSGLLPVKHDMPADLQSAQAGTNLGAPSTEPGIVSQHLAARFKSVDVIDSLVFVPGLERVSAYCQQVGFRAMRETKPSHGLAPGCGKFKRLSDSRKHVTFRGSAGITFVDGRTQRRKFRRVVFLLALQGS